MEKLKIHRLGEEKMVQYTNKKTGKPDAFNKIGFQAEEYKDRWYDFTYRGACPLSVGNSYDLEITEREYNGKTYYDAKLPHKAAPSEAKLDLILHELADIKAALKQHDF